MSGSRWVITPLLLSRSWRSFLYSSVYSCHLFLISSASVRSLQFLSFIEPIFAWNVPLVSLIFLKRSLVFPILLCSSTFLHRSLRKAFLSLLAILWNSACHSMIISIINVPTQEGDSRDLDSRQIQHKHPSVSSLQRISMTVHPRRC